MRELFISRGIRQTATGMMAVVSVLFLYDSGYSLVSIALLYAAYSAYKAVIAYPSATLLARRGVKHGIVVSNLIMAPTLVILSFLDELNAVALIAYFALYGLSITTYRIAYLAGFSQVKNQNNTGKELGLMSSLDKIAAALAPAIGGLVATLIHPQAAMWLGATLFIVSAIPLMLSSEIKIPHNRLHFENFPWKLARPSLVADGLVGFEASLRLVILPLFLTTVVFASMEVSDAYASVGIITSIGLVVGIILPPILGYLLDRGAGRKIYLGSTILTGIAHLTRPFFIAPWSATAAGIASEASAVSYEVSFLRGMIDMSDRTKNPVAYLLLLEVTHTLGSAIFFALTAIALHLLDVELGLTASFWIAALATFGILGARFPIFKR